MAADMETGMTDPDPANPWRAFLRLPNDSRRKMLLVAFLVALVCSSAVSLTAVSLKPWHEANLSQQRLQRMEQMLATLPGMGDVLQASDADSLQVRIVDLDSGDFVDDIDPAAFDFRAAMKDPELSVELERAADPARIGRRPKLAPVYLLHRDERLVMLILPVYGRGYQSTIHAYLALQQDLNTVAALQIIEQAETAGIGSRIAEPDWLARWSGRVVSDRDGVIRLGVADGTATGEFEVDAIAGATRSTNGVERLLLFWLGERGYGPLLNRLRRQED